MVSEMVPVTARKNTLSHVLELKPAKWNSERSIRAAFCIGFPFAAGLLANDIMTGMWVAMGCLMMVTGEGSGSYRTIYQRLIISAPIGALGYIFGYLGTLPWLIVVIVMGMAGFIASFLSSKNSIMSIATLQTLLLASIALGVPAIEPFWQPALLYLVGAVFYLVVFSIEVIIRRRHAQDPLPQKSNTHFAPEKTTLDTKERFLTALAFSICLAVAYSAHWFDRNGHWFWIPLTVGLVMKPDFGSIRDRAIQRVLGTIAGVLLGALVLAFVEKGALFVIIMAILAGLIPWAMQRSYILQAVFLTPLILMLVDVIMAGSSNTDYGMQRLIDTIIGGGIVIIIGYLPFRFFDKDNKL
ncbi:FUSC family protein [Brucellaceae bacterium C25G]